MPAGHANAPALTLPEPDAAAAVEAAGHAATSSPRTRATDASQTSVGLSLPWE